MVGKRALDLELMRKGKDEIVTKTSDIISSLFWEVVCVTSFLFYLRLYNDTTAFLPKRHDNIEIKTFTPSKVAALVAVGGIGRGR